MKKKILITGANGFVGKNICESLSHKYIFYTPQHTELELTDDKATLNYFKEHFFDIVIHCANKGGTRKQIDTNIIDYNLRMFFNILKCQKFYKKMIFIGSGAEYDRRKSLVKVKETSFGESIPVDQYGFSKYISSCFINKTDNIVNLRLFGIYGKYEDYMIRFISNSICRILFNLPVTINQNVFFDYLYIKDFIKIIDHFIQNKPKYKFYNVGQGKRRSLKSIADRILKVAGKNQNIKIFKPRLNKEYTCDVTRLRDEIPELKYTDFNKSIKELFTYYKSILPTIKKEDLYRFG